MNNEGKDMPGIVVEKARMNLWNIIGFAMGIAVTAFGWGITYNTAVTNDARAQEQIQEVQEDVRDIKQQLPAIPQLGFRVSSIEEQSTENRTAIGQNNITVNTRIDRVVESFGGKLDTLLDTINRLNVEVKVLTAQEQRRNGNSNTNQQR